MSQYDLYCPQCQKKADNFNVMFVRYSMQRLELPIFCCPQCRTIYIDKLTVRRIISEWRKEGFLVKRMAFEKLYHEFLQELENMMETHFIGKIGYKKVRFQKRPRELNPR